MHVCIQQICPAHEEWFAVLVIRSQRDICSVLVCVVCTVYSIYHILYTFFLFSPAIVYGVYQLQKNPDYPQSVFIIFSCHYKIRRFGFSLNNYK